MDRNTYLSHFTAEYIGKLCELNHIDVTKVRTKEERITCLCQLPHMIEESSPSPAQPSQAGMSAEDLTRLMKEMEISRCQETKQLCESLMKITMGPQPRVEYKLPGLHRLTGDDDVSCYLSTFERIATAEERPRHEWAKLLEPYLTGKAQQAFHSLSNTEKENYDAVVQVILRRYQLTPEAYRVKFKTDTKQSEETFEEFANRLQENFYKWVEVTPSTIAIPEVKRCFDLVMIDQLLSTVVDETLRLKLRERNERSLIVLARTADELLLHRRANSMVRRDESNVRKKQGQGGLTGSRQNSSGHFQGQTVSNSNRRGAFNQNCYHCGQLGHRMVDCPMPSIPARSPTTQHNTPTPIPGTTKHNPEIGKCNFIAPGYKTPNPPDVPKQGLPMMELTLKGGKETCIRTYGLLDSGSTVSLLPTDLREKLSLTVTPCSEGTTLKILGETTVVPCGMTCAEVEFGVSTMQVNFQVVQALPAPVLLGVDFAHAVKLVMDFGAGCFGTSFGVEKPVKFPMLGIQCDEPEYPDYEVDMEDRDTIHVPSGTKLDISSNEQAELETLLSDFQDVLCDVPGFTDVDSHRIDVGDAVPSRSHPYRMGPERKKALDEEISKLLESGKIEPSSSPWASPVVMVPKRGGTYRMCIDYRKLNSVTKIDAYPMPSVDDILQSLHGAQVFSSLDLKSGYWQMGVAPEDREKTAFVCEQGLFQFRVLPFGVVNGPASFQRLMHTVLGDLVGRCCYVYLDDIVCFSSSTQEHYKDLREVLSRLRAAGLTANFGKCQFLHTEMRYLGHFIGADGLRPDPEKVSAIRDYPVPTSVKDLERFLGMIGWYQKFVPGFADRAAPLYALKKRDAKWEWTEECSVVFHGLKEALMSEPVLGYPNRALPFVVHTDASNVGLGAILTQKQDSQTKTIAYASRTLSSAERNYSTTEKECLAIIWALEKWRPYLEGRPCKVVTDHQSSPVLALPEKEARGQTC